MRGSQDKCVQGSGSVVVLVGSGSVVVGNVIVVVGSGSVVVGNVIVVVGSGSVGIVPPLGG